MNQLPVEIWELAQAEAVDELLSVLKSEFTVETEPPTKSNVVLLDDFDAHIWNSDYLLCLDVNLHLQLIDQGGTKEETNFPQNAKFWWQLPDGSVQKTIKGLIGLRALMPIANIFVAEQQIALRNGDQKLVVRAQLKTITIDGQARIYFLLKPLRGYSKHSTQARNIVRSFASKKMTSHHLKHLVADRINPTSIEEKIPLPKIKDKMPTEQAVRSMSVAMLHQASSQVPGVIADVDTEFLHHFRVYFRKVRSLVGLLHKSIPVETVAILKPVLSEIAGKTNKLRDLDVFLLEKDKYLAMLPANFSAGLNELYEIVEQQREIERVNIENYFLSADYGQKMAMCISELSAPSALKTEIASKPLLPVVDKLVLKRYQKILDMVGLIDDSTVDEEIHELRKEFKKLRYLIEFFSDLFPQEGIRKTIGTVKKVQNVLGNFNDYSIQIEFLNTYLDNHRIEMSKAVCGLIAVLHQKKITERSKVNAATENIRSPEMINEIKHLFGRTS